MNLTVLLLVLALICFVLDAVWTPQPTWRVKLISLGLAFYVASQLVSGTLKTP